MSVPTNVTMPTYIIYRDIQTGQPFDPRTPLAFLPPKDSDELFDALRLKYPAYRTHAERMREAVIEFLLEEQQMSQLPTEQLPTPQTAGSNMTSPWQASMQSMSSDTSTWSSPDVFDLATPSLGNSPQPQAVPLSRQQSTTTTAANTSTSTPPALEQMTGVFSLSDATQPKQRVRRKMTEAEKVEYRKRRIVKACDKCSKRKRKCNHNQPEMESAGPSKAQKVTKPAAVSTSKKPPPTATPHIQHDNSIFGANTMNFNNSFESDVSMPSLADYSTIFEDTMPDMSMGDLLTTDGQQWPWSDSQDFTLMDSSMESLDAPNMTPPPLIGATGPVESNAGMHGYDNLNYMDSFGNDWSPVENPLLYNQTPQTLGVQNHQGSFGGYDQDMMQTTGGGDQQKEMFGNHLRTGHHVNRQQPTHTRRWHDAEGMDAFTLDQNTQNQLLEGGQNTPPSRIRSGDDERQSRFFSTDQNAARTTQAGLSGLGRYQSLSQMTLRLTGTAKAVKAFGNLLSSRSSRRRSSLQSVSLKKVALVALGGMSAAQNLQHPSAGATQPFTCSSCVADRQFFSQSEMNRHMKRVHGCRDARGDARGDPQGVPQNVPGGSSSSNYLDNLRINRPWPGMKIDDFLRMKTNVSPQQEDGREAVPIVRSMPEDAEIPTTASANAAAFTDAERKTKSKDLNNQPGSAYSEAAMRAHRSSAAQQGRLQPQSLGEGLITSTNPSTELYSLKHRMPRSAFSAADSGNATTALGPLLTTIPESVDTARPRDQERERVISRNTECTEGNNILTEGAAYQTSDVANEIASVCTRGLIRVENFALPVHTRGHNPAAAGFAGDTEQYHGAASLSFVRVETGSSPVHTRGRNLSASGTAGDTDQRQSTVSFGFTQNSVAGGNKTLVSPSATANVGTNERLSDHQRCRDHFGRPSLSSRAAGVLYSIATFAILLAVLSFVSTPATLSLLLLAMVSPTSENASTGKTDPKSLGTSIRNVIGGGSWPPTLRSLVPNFGPFRVYMQRLLYRGYESSMAV